MKLQTLNENELTIMILALTCLLGSAAIFGYLFERLKAPRVVGEIFGGMIIGGSCLYHLFPNTISGVFMGFPEEGKILNIFYQLGLIFLMFSSGFNTKLEVKGKNKRILSCLIIGSTVIPMALAVPFSLGFQKYFIGDNGNQTAFIMVFMIAVAITSIPVISKIFFDIGIMDTKFSNIVLTASTFQDLVLWVLLNIAINITTTGEVNIWNFLIVSILTIAVFIIVELVSGKLKAKKMYIKEGSLLTTAFIFLFIIVVLLSLLNINVMYSAFLAGYIVKSFLQLGDGASDKIKVITDFSFSFFIPIYFALVGIQLDVINNFSLIRFILFFITAFILEAAGTILLLLFSGLKRNMIINFAITMNARGGPGIVLATVAYANKIINVEFFTVLILTTMLSSAIAGYWLRKQKDKDEKVFNSI